MAYLLDIGRLTVPYKADRFRRKLRRRHRSPLSAQLRNIRAASTQTEPASQISKSNSKWPESVSSFFHRQRLASSRNMKEIIVMNSGGGRNNNKPPSQSDNGGRGDDSNDDDSFDAPELLTLAQAESMAAEKGARLPADFLKAAKTTGIRLTTLQSYFELQTMAVVGFLIRMFPWIRDRLIADPGYLFKVFTEVTIDSGCATLAEVRKRGADFMGEFEFYLSDLIVGLVLDVALVSLLAPVAVVGLKPLSTTKTGLRKYLARLPSALFEANIKGVREYTLSQRLISFFYKSLQYSVIGFGCGLVGQGMANSMMVLRRYLAGGATEADVAVPPTLKSALVWALFMAVSSNTRYQIVVGLERLVDITIAKRVPQAAYLTTIVIRFINNVVGGENFIDMARWAGIQ